MMIQDAIRKAVERQDLTRGEAAAAMTEIMDGAATPAQVASLITALRMKGETVDEITAFASVMREKSVKVNASRRPLVDTCGTGGDKLRTFNISTAVAFVAAGAGAAVAKHGNRAMSSKCGSADVLEALGVNIAMVPDQVAECIDSIGVGFMFAPAMHPAMKHAVGPRREIGVRTVFNILGPMTNPAGAQTQLIGVFAPEFVEPMASVLSNLGAERAIVAHGVDGLDELSTLGQTKVSEVRNGAVSSYVLEPSDLGLARATADQIAAGETPEDNARLLTQVLQGEIGPRRDIVCLNASAVLTVAGRAEDLRDGVLLAGRSIDSGAALQALEGLRRYTQEHSTT